MIGKIIKTKAFWPLVILLAAGIAALVVTTCTLEPDLDTVFQNAMDKLGTSYTVSANGANGSVTSDKLTFHFAEDIDDLDEGDITITNGTGKAEKDGALTGSDSDWVLPIKNVERGTVKVKINKEGIQSFEKIVTVFDDRITTYTVDSDGVSGTTSTTKLTFTFVEDIRGVGLVQGDIAITTGAGVATIKASSWNEIAPNNGTKFTLGVNAVSEGTIKVKITRAGIDDAVSAAIDIFKGAATAAIVNLDPGSDPSATAGDGEITMLIPNSFYKVVASGVTYYSKANGTLSTNIAEIAPLTGTQITGLTNNTLYTYKVNAATPYNDEVSVTYQVEDISIDFVKGSRSGDTNIPIGIHPLGDLKLDNKDGTDPGLYAINIGDFFDTDPARLGTLHPSGTSNTTTFQYIAFGREDGVNPWDGVGPFAVAYGEDSTGYHYVSDNSAVDPDGIYIWKLEGYQSATSTSGIGEPAGTVQKYTGYEFYFPVSDVDPRTYLFSCDNGDFVYLKISLIP